MEFKILHKDRNVRVCAVYMDGRYIETRIILIDADGFDEKEITITRDGEYDIADCGWE